MAALARLDILKTLGDNTRYAIYLELARSPRPLSTADISSTIELHPNTVRPHLERMRDVGLVEVSIDNRGQIGRPQHRYSLAADAPSLGFEPPIMPMMASMLVTLVDRIGADSDDIYQTGFEEGGRRAGRHVESPSGLEALVDDLDELGFDPVVTDSDNSHDAATIGFSNCPFSDLAASSSQVICELHRGMVAGFSAAQGDTEVAEFCGLAARTPCQVTIGIS